MRQTETKRLYIRKEDFVKRYIIIGTFFDMGGGQLYTRNKTDFLKKTDGLLTYTLEDLANYI